MVPIAFPTDKNKKQNEKAVSLAPKQWGVGVICIFDYLSFYACDYEKTKRLLNATNATQQFNNITSQHLYHLYKLPDL